MLLFHGMPDLETILFAFLTVLAVKLIGYSLAGWTLQRYYHSKFNFFLFAVVRLVVGFVIGLMFFSAGFSVYLSTEELIGRDSDLAGIVFFIVPLLLSRLFVWALLVWAIFERGDFRWKRYVAVVVLGTVWSCVLDAVALSVTNLISVT